MLFFSFNETQRFVELTETFSFDDKGYGGAKTLTDIKMMVYFIGFLVESLFYDWSLVEGLNY